MRYSVWDNNRRSFGVYEDSRPMAIMDEPRRCKPTVRPGVGNMIDVNRTLCVLPRDARQVAWSDVAVGEVVQLAGAGGSSGVRPGLGGFTLFAPGGVGGGTSAAPSGGLGFSFQEAVAVNVLVSLVSGLITTFVFKKVFTSTSSKR